MVTLNHKVSLPWEQELCFEVTHARHSLLALLILHSSHYDTKWNVLTSIFMCMSVLNSQLHMPNHSLIDDLKLPIQDFFRVYIKAMTSNYGPGDTVHLHCLTWSLAVHVLLLIWRLDPVKCFEKKSEIQYWSRKSFIPNHCCFWY